MNTRDAVDFIERRRNFVLAFWLIAAAVAAPFAPSLLQDTELTFTPPQTSKAAQASRAVKAKFPIVSNVTNLVVLAESLDGSDITKSSALRSYCYALNDTVWQKFPDVIFDFQSYFTLDRLGVPKAMSAALLQQNPSSEGGGPSSHPTSTIFVLTVRGEETSKGLIRFTEDLRATMKDGVLNGTAALERANVALTLTGLPALYNSIISSAIHDLETMDAMVLPIAFCILALLLRSFRLLLIPLVCLGVSAALSFSTVDALTKAGVPILTAAPSLMCSVFIAMSIDYSMFLLTRFQEEKIKLELVGPNRTSWRLLPTEKLRLHLRPIIAAVLGSSGKIVLASGSTLIICFLGLLLLPLDLMQSIGISCAISLFYTMTVNLILGPALLFTFPRFFLDSCIPSFVCGSTGVWSSNARASAKSRSGLAEALLIDKAAEVETQDIQSTNGSRGGTCMSISIVNELSSESVGLTGSLEDSRHRSSSRLSATGLTDSPRAIGDSSVTSFEDDKMQLSSSSKNTTDERFLPEGTEQLRATFWYKIVSVTQTWWGSLLILVIVVACTVPLGLNAFDGELSASLDDYLPRGSPGRNALQKISKEFSSGTAYPYRLVIECPTDGVAYQYIPGNATSQRGSPMNVTSVVDKAFFDIMQPVLQDMVAQKDPALGAFPNSTQIESFLYIKPGIGVVQYEIIKLALSNPSLLGPIGPFLQNMVNRDFANSDKSAAIVEILVGAPPFSKSGREWIANFRERVAAISYTIGMKMEVSGFGGDVADSLESVYSAWPTMACIIGGTVLLIVGLSFKSFVIAARGVITIGLTIIFVSGLAKLVYVDGIFSTLGLAGVSENTGLVWLVQPTIFPLLVGIALDYDIFLIGRIVELHNEGISTRNAILLGVASTGTIITAAGIIQALAFFGLMLSSIQVLNQLSFFLFFAVLFDTFVVRTLVVPSIMFWLGRANFW